MVPSDPADEQPAHKYPVRLLSRSEAIIWPRYEVQLPPGLSTKEAVHETGEALRTAARQVLTFSQWRYDRETDVVDTRVRREDF